MSIDTSGSGGRTLIIGTDVRAHEVRSRTVSARSSHRNYELLLAKVASWLKPKADSFGGTGALVFIHIFAHRSQPCPRSDARH